LADAVYTIGCSTHSIEHFLMLLTKHKISAVADVRSVPYSRLHPQFNREALEDALKGSGIEYVFLGRELGARSDDPRCYENGKVRYERLAATELFRDGLNRVRRGMLKHRIALMCAEKDPLLCHRTILVARKLAEDGVPVIHILADGSVETHEQVLSRLLDMLDIPENDLFRSREEASEDAYRIQGEAIAYSGPSEGRD